MLDEQLFLDRYPINQRSCRNPGGAETYPVAKHCAGASKYSRGREVQRVTDTSVGPSVYEHLVVVHREVVTMKPTKVSAGNNAEQP
jgi:hypothetical protein